MTVLQGLAILEAAALECKKRDTPEIGEALDFFRASSSPAARLIPQYRDHIVGHDRTTEVALEGQRQVLRATFPGIRDSVQVLFQARMDARKFHVTHDMKVKGEVERLSGELINLDGPSVFVRR